MADFLGITADTWTKVGLGVFTLVGFPVMYFWGGRQKIAAEREKARMDAENAAKVAQAQTTTAESNVISQILGSGQNSLKTILEVGKGLTDLTEKLGTMGEELATVKATHAQQISDLKLEYQAKIFELREKVQTLEGQVALLRREIEVKDSALKDCAIVRQRVSELERDNSVLKSENDELTRANSAMLYLWEAATENRGEPALVNLAEQAIYRVLNRANAQTGSTATTAAAAETRSPTGTEAAVAVVAVTVKQEQAREDAQHAEEARHDAAQEEP
jgi:hypothetical protein